MRQTTYAYIITLLFSSVSLLERANAAPWGQPENDAILISRLDIFHAEEGGDPDVNFDQYSSNFYVELGLRNNFTLIGKATYSEQQISDEKLKAGSGFSALELGLQRKFHHNKDNVQAWRVLYSGKTSLTYYDINGNQEKAGQDAAIEAAWLWGKTLPTQKNRQRYLTGDIGYRALLGEDADQIRTEFEYATSLAKNWLLSLKSYNQISLKNNDPGGQDYDLYRIEPALRWDRGKKSVYELGLILDIDGRNIQTGTGIFFNTWSRF